MNSFSSTEESDTKSCTDEIFYGDPEAASGELRSQRFSEKRISWQEQKERPLVSTIVPG